MASSVNADAKRREIVAEAADAMSTSIHVVPAGAGSGAVGDLGETYEVVVSAKVAHARSFPPRAVGADADDGTRPGVDHARVWSAMAIEEGSMRSRKLIVAIAGTLVLAAVAVSLAFVGTSEATTAAATRTLYVSAVEFKGSASVAKEPYPGPVPAGGGWESCAPGSDGCDLKGDTTKWAVETYRFDTATVVAYAGERVVIKAFGVNAAKHDIVVPTLKKSFTIKRGVLTTADLGVVKKPGIYRILCITHPPAHQMDLVVLPKP